MAKRTKPKTDILGYLFRRSPDWVTFDDLIDATGVSRNVAYRVVNELFRSGLIKKARREDNSKKFKYCCPSAIACKSPSDLKIEVAKGILRQQQSNEKKIHDLTSLLFGN